MLRKAYTPARLFAQGAVLILGGILIFLYPARFLALALTLCQWLLAAAAVATLLDGLSHLPRLRPTLVKGLVLAVGEAALLLLPQGVGASVSLVFGLWMVVNALFKFIYALQLRIDRQRGVALNLIGGVINGLFALALLLHRVQSLLPLTVLLGLYGVVYGVYALIDGLRELLGTDIRGQRIRQRIRICPPILLSTFLPRWLLRALDDPDEAEETARWTRRETRDEAATCDLEIFLHLSRDTAMGFGHVDIALGDHVYSYGCYDAASNRLFGLISDGVLVEADRARYIPYCLTKEKKKLISFGVTLTDEQKARVRQAAADFLQGSIPWTPPAGSEQAAFQQAAGAAFHKLQDGPFKTYNVLKTNCVALANLLCGASGLDLMNLQGIVTPGTYYAFLDRQFRRPNSIVISRTVYR